VVKVKGAQKLTHFYVPLSTPLPCISQSGIIPELSNFRLHRAVLFRAVAAV